MQPVRVCAHSASRGAFRILSTAGKSRGQSSGHLGQRRVEVRAKWRSVALDWRRSMPADTSAGWDAGWDGPTAGPPGGTPRYACFGKTARMGDLKAVYGFGT